MIHVLVYILVPLIDVDCLCVGCTKEGRGVKARRKRIERSGEKKKERKKKREEKRRERGWKDKRKKKEKGEHNKHSKTICTMILYCG